MLCIKGSSVIEQFSFECRKYNLATDWLKKISCHFLSQSNLKLNPIVTCAYAFSRAWRRLYVFASSFDWFIEFPATVVVGQSNYFGFSFSTPSSIVIEYKVIHIRSAWLKSYIFKIATCTISHSWHRVGVFLRLKAVTCFPALGSGCMFSRA